MPHDKWQALKHNGFHHIEAFKQGHIMATSLTEAAKAMGAKGGKSGGPARARKLTRAQRIRIAKLGGDAKARRKQA